MIIDKSKLLHFLWAHEKLQFIISLQILEDLILSFRRTIHQKVNMCLLMKTKWKIDQKVNIHIPMKAKHQKYFHPIKESFYLTNNWRKSDNLNPVQYHQQANSSKNILCFLHQNSRDSIELNIFIPNNIMKIIKMKKKIVNPSYSNLMFIV